MRFYAGARQAVEALVSSLLRHAAWQIKDFNETGPARGGMLEVQMATLSFVFGGDVLPPGTDGAGRGGRGVGMKAGGRGVIQPSAK